MLRALPLPVPPAATTTFPRGRVRGGRVAHTVGADGRAVCNGRPVGELLAPDSRLPSCCRCRGQLQQRDRFARPRCIYLLHFSEPYRHAKHYIGSTDDLPARLLEHRRGRGARLLEVVTAAGIDFVVARTWVGTRTLERSKKRQGGASRLCPICRGRIDTTGTAPPTALAA